MRKFEVVAVIKKNVERALTQPEMDLVIKAAKKGCQTLVFDQHPDRLVVLPWHREILAEIVPTVIRSVRKLIGPDPEIIHLEVVPEGDLAEAQN
ncbi:MAG TPA: hypothetical protein VMT55_01705 [Candidatus Sulfotelmatobacter sp.]|nr:hypothetical protein [Candidatus Sulfotelmatobacter sp.]